MELQASACPLWEREDLDSLFPFLGYALLGTPGEKGLGVRGGSLPESEVRWLSHPCNMGFAVRVLQSCVKVGE